MVLTTKILLLLFHVFSQLSIFRKSDDTLPDWLWMASRKKCCHQKLGIRHLIMKISDQNYVTNSKKKKKIQQKTTTTPKCRMVCLPESPFLSKKSRNSDFWSLVFLFGTRNVCYPHLRPSSQTLCNVLWFYWFTIYSLLSPWLQVQV